MPKKRQSHFDPLFIPTRSFSLFLACVCPLVLKKWVSLNLPPITLLISDAKTDKRAYQLPRPVMEWTAADRMWCNGDGCVRFYAPECWAQRHGVCYRLRVQSTPVVPAPAPPSMQCFAPSPNVTRKRESHFFWISQVIFPSPKIFWELLSSIFFRVFVTYKGLFAKGSD